MFALVDVNSFYASCEIAFRPDLRGRPVVVLSNNDGCVIARNHEAKLLEIPMGAPYFKVKSQFERHQVAVFSSNYALYGEVLPQGLIGVMSSGQGSLSNNTGGQRELYRGSKAALNMFMRSFAARPASVSHPMVVMAPGWIRTALGGESAPLTMAETIPSLVNVLLEKQNRPGLEYLDYRGCRVPW